MPYKYKENRFNKKKNKFKFVNRYRNYRYTNSLNITDICRSNFLDKITEENNPYRSFLNKENKSIPIFGIKQDHLSDKFNTLIYGIKQENLQNKINLEFSNYPKLTSDPITSEILEILLSPITKSNLIKLKDKILYPVTTIEKIKKFLINGEWDNYKYGIDMLLYRRDTECIFLKLDPISKTYSINFKYINKKYN